MSESSAAQAIAWRKRSELDPDRINPDGGAVVRGHPFGAAGAVLVVRSLHRRMVRREEGVALELSRYGVATLGAIGGMGLAALVRSRLK